MIKGSAILKQGKYLVIDPVIIVDELNSDMIIVDNINDFINLIKDDIYCAIKIEDSDDLKYEYLYNHKFKVRLSHPLPNGTFNIGLLGLSYTDLNKYPIINDTEVLAGDQILELPLRSILRVMRVYGEESVEFVL